MKPIYLIRDNTTEGEVRVDRFPSAPRAMNTVAIYTADFEGTVRIYATIELEPTEDDWFLVWEEEFPVFTNQMEEKARNKIRNIVGCFVWMRAEFEKLMPNRERGIVDRVTVL